MKKFFFGTTIVCLVFFPGNVLFGQVSQYFDDGGISERSKIIKVGFDVVNGEMPFIFEHTLTKRFTVEWGAGPVSLKRQTSRYQEEPLPIESSGLGMTAWGKIRFYMKGDYEKWHFGFQPKLTFMSGKRFTDIVFFTGGYQFLLKNHFVLDLEAGMGTRVFRNTTMIGSVPYTDRDSRFFLPVLIKAGYLF
jgi:hypothetical protein